MQVCDFWHDHPAGDWSFDDCQAAAARQRELVLETLPNGEAAWLRPPDDDVRYVLTDLGQRTLAHLALFGSFE